jgi:chromosome transmission fidelity protein 8
MPSIPLRIAQSVGAVSNNGANALPQLLQTPSGLAIVEIQGTIHSTGSDIEDENLDQTSIGRIVFPSYDSTAPVDDTAWMKRIFLYVGKHQRLTGEVKKLAKPYGIIRKREITTAVDNPSEELELVEIVKYKLVFSHRPEPVGGELAQ